MNSHKSIIIIGSTGSVGANTLSVIAEYKNAFNITALVAHVNADKLLQQAIEFKPKYAILINEDMQSIISDKAYDIKQLKADFATHGTKLLFGKQALRDVIEERQDIAVVASTGIAALEFIPHIVAYTKKLCIANKETIICGFHIIQQAASASGCVITPLDSEHAAIHQLLSRNSSEPIKVTITASGGPFRDYTREQMLKVTPAEAIRHPNWSMGNKISVDCATLMNKGFEILEAVKLFNISTDTIIHRQSIIHALIHYIDGSVIAQMSMPTMRQPIAYALFGSSVPIKHSPVELHQIKQLSFEQPDLERFPLLKLMLNLDKDDVVRHIIIDAANTAAVELFLDGHISFLEIEKYVFKALENIEHNIKSLNSVYEVNALHSSVYNNVKSYHC